MNDFLAGIFAAMLALFGGGAEPAGYTGYVEADFLYMAPDSGGRIASLTVREGDGVQEGQVLFTLEDDQQQAQLAAAQARVEAAEATLTNLVTGSRNAELDVIRASLAKARADLDLARTTLERTEKLHAAGTASAAQLDQSRNGLAAAQAQADQLAAQLAVAELPARSAEQTAAEANLAAAQADARNAEIELRHRVVTAPAGGMVGKVLYSAGEVAAAGAPVIAILPAGALEARFFVPETERAGLTIGQVLDVSCDGCGAMTARITSFSSTPQTTPPVIYSREERSRLVYLVKARLEGGTGLLPGQPITVLP
ncbi:MAG: hypothetical protein ABS76_04325 [Pelagibacterium sp. SCN 64-44]|nr:MAG: hypothetical protein ABS76_04325 [Pelagibacterium sp. SCN 64-44]